MKVFHQGLILVGVPLLIEVLLIGNLWILLKQADKERQRENRYRQYSAMGARLMALTYEAPYLIITSMQVRDQKLVTAYENDINQIRNLQKQTRAMALNDPLVEDANKELDDSLESYLSLTESIAAAQRTGSAMALLTEIPKIQSRFNSSKNLAMDRIALMIRIGQRSLQLSEKRIAHVRFLQSAILTCGLIGNLAVGAILLYFYRRQIMRRLRVITQNTLSLSQGKELALPLSGYDEIAQLDQAFHSMDRELKEVSERERALFNNASDVICVLDTDNTFVKINPACDRLWNYSQDAMLKHSLFDLVSVDEIDKARESLALAKSSSEPTSFELKIKTGKQAILETLWSSYWSQAESSLYCVVHDITERKNIERVKQHFLSMISSDLKRPLSSISKTVATLLSSSGTGLSKIACAKLSVAEKNVLRLLGLVNDLLQIAEMESGQLEIIKEDTSVEDLLRRSVQDVEVVAQKQGVQLELAVSANRWYVDPDRIMQVLVNLLSNAIKFSPQGAVVTLSARQDGELVEVKVIDRGRGVPAKYRQAIFEKFKQVEAADGKRKSGTGLGLPICKQIIEEHGGRIGVDSEEGKGSTFWFAVPLDETASLKMKALGLQDSERALSSKGNQKQMAAVGQNLPESKSTRSPALPVRAQQGGRLKLSQKGLLLVGVPILFELAFVAVLSLQLTQTDQYRQAELKQRRMATNASRLLQEYLKSAVLMAGAKTQDSWIAFEQCYRDLIKTRHDLQFLVMNDPIASRHYAKVEEYNKKADQFYQQAVKSMGDGYSPSKHDKAFEGRTQLLPLTAGIARRLQSLIHDAEKREFRPELQAQQRAAQAGLLMAGLAANVMISILLALFFSKDMSARLATLADNAERLAKEQTLNNELGGSDEIAQLDRAFHSTADALDIARKKERAVFDNSQDLICALDIEGRFLTSNPACVKMLGYPREELLQKTIIDITFDEDKDKTRKTLLSEFESTTHKTLENRVIRKDKSQIYILWSASENLEAKHIYTVAHDISSRKELEQLKQEFLAMVSHDLRTPLTSITGIAKLIMAGAFGPPDENVNQFLQSISREGDNLLELINDLLDIEKLEAGQMQLVLEKVSLRELMEKSLDGLPAAGKSRLDISLPPAGLSIPADRDRIIQALSNLLNHALAGQTNGSSVQMSVADFNDSIEIDLQVSGRPLSENARERLFDRFNECAGGDSQAEQHSGLALPIARCIVENHGGSIGVRVRDDSAANIFWMRLPKSKKLDSPIMQLPAQ